MKKDQEITYYPVFLNITARNCVVVGGGQVALRKVKILLEHGADVTVISPALCPALARLIESGEIHALPREYREGDLENVFVAIAATDDSVINRRIVEEARKKAVIVNVVDDAESSDFIVPSFLRRGKVTVAVSTSGKSPALARKIRSTLEKQLGSEYALLADLLGEIRGELKQEQIELNGDSWQEAIDLDFLLDLLRNGENEKAKVSLINRLKAKQPHPL